MQHLVENQPKSKAWSRLQSSITTVRKQGPLEDDGSIKLSNGLDPIRERLAPLEWSLTKALPERKTKIMEFMGPISPLPA